jgi:hypothetical protein
MSNHTAGEQRVLFSVKQNETRALSIITNVYLHYVTRNSIEKWNQLLILLRRKGRS